MVDLGPEGGHKGGRIVAAGTPEDGATVHEGTTGQYRGGYLTAASETRKRA